MEFDDTVLHGATTGEACFQGFCHGFDVDSFVESRDERDDFAVSSALCPHADALVALGDILERTGFVW